MGGGGVRVEGLGACTLQQKRAEIWHHIGMWHKIRSPIPPPKVYDLHHRSLPKTCGGCFFFLGGGGGRGFRV